MIRPRFAIPTIFVLLAATGGARAVDKDKLRRAIFLPRIGIIVGYGVNAHGGFSNQREAMPEPEKIAEIEKDLKGDATDAERYSCLAKLYFRSGQPDKAKEARRKVVSIRRKQLQQHPDDPDCRLRLADALEYVHELAEAETLVRQVVKDPPADWHAWLALGENLDLQCWRAATGDKPFRPLGREELLQSLREAQPSPERVAAARRYRGEAVACFNRAVTLAPHTAETYRLRGATCYHYGFLDLGLRLYAGEKGDDTDLMDCFMGRKALPDLRKAVDLSCDEYMGIGMVALAEVMAEVLGRQARNSSVEQAERLIDLSSEPTRKRVREDMARLEKGTHHSDKHKAAEAAEVLGYLQVMLSQDNSAAEKSARRSIELDPTREVAWDVLALSLIESQSYRKAVTVFRQRLQHKESARTRLLLAKAYEHLGQIDKAEEVVRAGLMREPNDFLLRVAQADLLLKRGDDESLSRAGSILYGMREEKCLAAGRGEDWANYVFAGGAYFGLIGERATAQEWFEKLQQQEPEYEEVKKALNALDEPALPVTPPSPPSR